MSVVTKEQIAENLIKYGMQPGTFTSNDAWKLPIPENRTVSAQLDDEKKSIRFIYRNGDNITSVIGLSLQALIQTIELGCFMLNKLKEKEGE